MALAVKNDELPHPIDTSLFRADAAMTRAQMNTQPFQQLGRRRGRRGLRSHPANFRFG